MRETLWVSLPQQEADAIKGIIKFITEKKLDNLSINELIQKLTDNQAADWEAVVQKYNAIPSVQNLPIEEMLSRTEGVGRKFQRNGYPQLETKEFKPNELISLVILCYSNPALIGPKLCKALAENNKNDVAKEITENLAYVRAKGRVVPWASNLRLLNYAFYSNDTSVQLPSGILNRIREGAAVHNITLIEIGNLTSNVTDLTKINTIDLAAIHFESLPVAAAYRHNQLTSGESSSSVSSGNTHVASSNLVPTLLFLHSIPVISTVARNLGKDLVSAINYAGSFFTKHNDGPSNKDVEQHAEILSATVKR